MHDFLPLVAIHVYEDVLRAGTEDPLCRHH